MKTQIKCSYVFKENLLKKIKNYKFIYLLILPAIIYYVLFSYIPMYGIQLAFKEYAPNLGISGSPWVWFDNFKYLSIDEGFISALINTVVISFLRIVLTFPIPIVFAILFNEIRAKGYKKVLQTVYTFPHFLSWIIVSGIIVNLFSNAGAVNNVLSVLGLPKLDLLLNKSSFRFLLIYSDVWKEAGWSMIIYLAAITGIDQSLYEAATVDGANRWHKILHITWPGISNMVIVMLILSIGNIMNAGFDQILNMYNSAVYPVADILDTYIYRMTFEKGMPFGVSTAIGLFKGVTNAILLLSANFVVKLFGGKGIV